MRLIILLFVFNIWTIIKGDHNDISFKLTTNETETYYCSAYDLFVINENDTISVTVELEDSVTPQMCVHSENSTLVFVNELSTYNINTGLKQQGDVVTAILSMSTIWNCYVLVKTDKLVYCNFSVYVRNIVIPKIIINDEEIFASQPDNTTTDYDAIIVYSYVRGRPLTICCSHNETTGMKFVYNRNGTNEDVIADDDDFNYNTSVIHYVLTNASSDDGTYIDCIVKRNENKNAIVRIYFQELPNGGPLLLIELGFVLFLAFLIITYMAIKSKRSDHEPLSETEVSFSETIDNSTCSDSFGSSYVFEQSKTTEGYIYNGAVHLH